MQISLLFMLSFKIRWIHLQNVKKGFGALKRKEQELRIQKKMKRHIQLRQDLLVLDIQIIK